MTHHGTTQDDHLRAEARRRVIAIRGSNDVPGFDACVEAELEAMRKAGDSMPAPHDEGTEAGEGREILGALANCIGILRHKGYLHPVEVMARAASYIERTEGREATVDEAEAALGNDGHVCACVFCVHHRLTKAGLYIFKRGSVPPWGPIEARPEQVFSALSEPTRQYSQKIQYELRESGWIIVRKPTL